MSYSDRPKVIVGMSGGVDSSVAALLLKEKGYAIEGLFMKNWEEDDTDSYCAASEDIKDAQAVCDKLGIPLHTVNFASEYWDNVFTYFLKEYEAGRTPNPDILCNREIKFKVCLDYVLSLGADAFATGHYARNENQQLLKAFDKNKDQTYFIYTLTPEILSKAIFPLGDLLKPDIRKIAHEAGFINHAKKDSTGICFIGERRFNTFLEKYLSPKPGPLKTTDGNVVGTHNGLMFYTIGQRQGIKLGGQKEGTGEPWYVVDKNIADNSLIIAQGHDHPALYAQGLICSDVHWINPVKLPLKCQAKTRYRQSDQACKITVINEDKQDYLVIFDTPQWAITPGQSIVFYDNDVCLGGGIIVERQ